MDWYLRTWEHITLKCRKIYSASEFCVLKGSLTITSFTCTQMILLGVNKFLAISGNLHFYIWFHFLFLQSLMSSQYAVLSLQSCGSIPLCTSQHYTAFHAMCGVLTSLMLHHTETVLKVIPTFISCTNHIL